MPPKGSGAVSLVLAALVLLTIAPAEAAPQSPVLREPVYGTDVREAGIRNFPDPAVLRVGERYFAFSSNSTGEGSRNIAVMRSDDLYSWSAPRGDAPTSEALPRPPGPGD